MLYEWITLRVLKRGEIKRVVWKKKKKIDYPLQALGSARWSYPCIEKNYNIFLSSFL